MSETIQKPYVFRRLASSDVFLMSKIISKIGINEFTSCFEHESIKSAIASFTAEKKADGDDRGAAVIGISVMLEIGNVILANLPKCEKEIYQILSQTSDLKVNEIQSLDAVVFMEMVIDFIKKDEFKDFIKVVSRLFK